MFWSLSTELNMLTPSQNTFIDRFFPYAWESDVTESTRGCTHTMHTHTHGILTYFFACILENMAFYIVYCTDFRFCCFEKWITIQKPNRFQIVLWEHTSEADKSHTAKTLKAKFIAEPQCLKVGQNVCSKLKQVGHLLQWKIFKGTMSKQRKHS